MKLEELLKLKGKKLSAAVAEIVMGGQYWTEKRGRKGEEYTYVYIRCDGSNPWKYNSTEEDKARYNRISFEDLDWHSHIITNLPDYAEDDSEAFEIVDRLKDYGYFTLTYVPSLKSWKAAFNATTEDICAIAATRSEAICKAALIKVLS